MSKTTVNRVAPVNAAPPAPPKLPTNRGTTLSDEWFGEGKYQVLRYEVPVLRDPRKAIRILRTNLSLN